MTMRVRFGLLALTIIALSAMAGAETIDVSDNHGGLVSVYDSRWAGLAARGVHVRIVGPCQSACTVLLGHIPRANICVTPRASFGFHQAGFPRSTAILWAAYSSDIRAWIDQHGGLQKNFVWMRAPDTYRFFKRC
jgi:hypothetical protein